jgi:outer membrane biosynthesis protein TonB
MSRSEDGEFELILGNKQLLSVFFIVVVLLGVFFTMGYIVGKNSFSEDYASQKEQKPLVVESPLPAKRDANSLVIEPVKPSPLGEVRTTPTPAPVEERPKQEQTKKEEKTKKTAKAETPVPTPAPTPRPVEPPKSGKSVLTGNGEPAPGQTFLQVVASTRPDSEIIADVLKRKGFAAIVVPGPTQDVYRVLVGPLSDAAGISKTRSDLEAAGFQKPYLRKY